MAFANLGAERFGFVEGDLDDPLKRFRRSTQRQVSALRYVDRPKQRLEHLVSLGAVLEEAKGLANVREVRHKLPEKC